MKKTNNSNPLKTFNDNKAMAYKKAGGEMAAFKKFLTKAENGIEVNSQGNPVKSGPLSKNDMAFLDYQYPSTNPKVPFYPSPEGYDVRKNRTYFGSNQNNTRTPAKEMELRNWAEKEMRGNSGFNTRADMESVVRRKGGSVKRKKK
jgi:hypothetical protein